MTVSVIISVYKDVLALQAILRALENQTMKNFDVIVSEDDNCQEMIDFLQSFETSLTITHITQEDMGWRKSRALNRALASITSDYIIFIDGDCVPHPCFVENHCALSSQKHYIAAKRVFMGPRYSEALKNGQMHPKELTNGYLLWHYNDLRNDPCSSLEDAFYLSPSFFHATLLPTLRTKSLIGCNFSCYREALVKINGFDESYSDPSVGEDDDLEWRLKALGLSLKSGRNMCIVYHLFHKKGFNDTIYAKNKQIMREKMASGQYRCEQGMDRYAHSVIVEDHIS